MLQRSMQLFLPVSLVDANSLDSPCSTDRHGMNPLQAARIHIRLVSLTICDQVFSASNLVLCNSYIRVSSRDLHMQELLDELFACKDVVGDANLRLRRAQCSTSGCAQVGTSSTV